MSVGVRGCAWMEALFFLRPDRDFLEFGMVLALRGPLPCVCVCVCVLCVCVCCV